MLQNSLLFGLLVLGLGLSGCGPQPLFTQNQEIPNKIWERNHTLNFDVEVVDTMKTYDFYLNIRNSGVYPFANIYMFINTEFPNGKSARDTVECILADGAGRWLGDGLGDIWDNQILFKKNVRFPSMGVYTFELEQGMRMENLPAIMDVGITIKPHQRN